MEQTLHLGLHPYIPALAEEAEQAKEVVRQKVADVLTPSRLETIKSTLKSIAVETVKIATIKTIASTLGEKTGLTSVLQEMFNELVQVVLMGMM